MLELMPGDVADASAGEQWRTLLGSCVSVILTDPRRSVAAMCHIVHVGPPNADNQNNTAYGGVAMAEMARRLQKRGITPRFCEAYVYGGGNMFPQLYRGRSIGEANADWVLDYLQAAGVRVLVQDVGGQGYRKVSWTVGPQAPLVDIVPIEQGRALA